MKNLLFFLSLTLILSSCKVFQAIKDHTSVNFTTPKKVTDPIELVFKIWGGADMVSQFVPASSKFGQFVSESEKYCVIRITQFPKNGNDTLAVTLKCQSDSITKKIGSLLGLTNVLGELAP